MERVLALNWWALALRGVLAVIFGLIAFFMPVPTLYALTILFGVYALIDGFLSIGAAIHSARAHEHWWALLLEGIAGVCAAMVAFMAPALTLLVVIYIIASWGVVTGILEIVAAIRLRRFIRGEWLLALAGLASIVFGLFLFAAPVSGAIVIAWWMGAYVLVFGLLMIGVAFRLRRWHGGLRLQHA
jgi:uncharacterized membrane protein HdeD (DUF308 family)